MRVTLRHTLLASMLTLSCWLLADMVNGYVSHALLQVTPLEPSTNPISGSPGAQAPTPDATELVNAILSSGLFVVPVNVSALDPDGQGAAAPSPPPIELAGKLKLLGTAIRDRGRPSAAIEDLKDRKQTLYFLEDTIEGFGQLTAVSRNGVTIQEGNRQGFLRLDDPVTQQVPVSVTSPPAGTTTKFAASPKMIDRRQLGQSISDFSKLMTEARAVPYYNMHSAKLEGWQFIEIKPKSVLDQLGIQERDILLRINGTPVHDPETLLRLLQEIRYATKVVKLDLIRNSESQTLAYDIR